MPTKPHPQQDQIDEALFDQGVEEILAEHGGDPRKAIHSLLQQVSHLEKARDRALSLVSYGYARGKLN